MKFKKEEDMYDVIGKYFEQNDYLIIIDKPRGSGIKFDVLKGWRIDVAGFKKDNNTTEVIAVEVKNNLGAQSVLQAISQAEMYKRGCNKVYVAFPKDDFDSKNNKDVVAEIYELCSTKGIGILKVGKSCKEVVSAATSYPKIDTYTSIINQFQSDKFQGFDVEDFARSYLDDADLVRYKFILLKEEMERRLKPKRLILTHEPTLDSWRFSFVDNSLKDKRYFDVPHFSIVWWDYGVMCELFLRSSTYLNALKVKVKNDDSQFYKILKQLKKSRYSYEIKIKERVHLGGYETAESSEYILRSTYLDRDNYQAFIEFLLKKRNRKIWLKVERLFYLSEENCQSDKLLDDLEDVIDDLMDFYKYLIQKEKK